MSWRAGVPMEPRSNAEWRRQAQQRQKDAEWRRQQRKRYGVWEAVQQGLAFAFLLCLAAALLLAVLVLALNVAGWLVSE